MTAKQWLVRFVLTAVGLALLLMLFNILTDPFGVFGDPLLDWWSYNMTNNPRAAKLTWLNDHFDDYDSYIVGCSSTSSFPVETLNRYTGNRFYNCIMYGADMLDCENTIAYLLEHDDDVREIWLNVYLDNGMEYDTEPNRYTHAMLPAADGSNPIPFYARFLFLNPEYGINKLADWRRDTWLAQPFDVFDSDTGAYDKRKRDVEPISDTASYLKAYPVFADYPVRSGYSLPETAACMDSVARIKALCDEADVQLTVVTAPVYADYLAYFNAEEILAFYRSLADVTDFWDFSISSVSFEPRYFYDETHFRNAVGDMALARIFGDAEAYIPADFGRLVTADNAEETLVLRDITGPLPEDVISARLPVLMYHHIADEINDVTVTAETFESHIRALSEAGYTAVSLAEIEAYVKGHGTLPEKPVLITFDDGYASNYEIAYPILEKYGMKAAIFVIGVSVGRDTYKDTGTPIIPHFGYDEMTEMLASGVIEIGSHTYDLHQSETLDGDGALTDVLRPDGMEELHYLFNLVYDHALIDGDLRQNAGVAVNALAYPRGQWSPEAAASYAEDGITMTFSTEEGVHTLVRGLPQSLYAIRRFNIGGAMTAEDVLLRVSQAGEIVNPADEN